MASHNAKPKKGSKHRPKNPDIPAGAAGVAAPAREQANAFDMLDKLADHDQDLIDRATESVRDPETGRACLHKVTRYILKETAPGLSATLSAAEHFLRAHNIEIEQVTDLPHFQAIVTHADSDLKAPQYIFNAASRAMHVLQTINPPVNASDIGPLPLDKTSLLTRAIHNALYSYKQRPHLH